MFLSITSWLGEKEWGGRQEQILLEGKMTDVNVTLRTICAPSEDIVAREIEGDTIIVPLVAGIGDADDELYTLNETGQAIWQKLDGRRTLDEVAKTLKQEFDGDPGMLESDVLGFAAEMTRRGILVARN